MADKVCQCGNPTVKQALPDGFRGKLKCANCDGLFEYPTPELRYKGDDRVEGFVRGGADYLTKPFSFSELLVRVQALIRRTTQSSAPT